MEIVQQYLYTKKKRDRFVYYIVESGRFIAGPFKRKQDAIDYKVGKRKYV